MSLILSPYENELGVTALIAQEGNTEIPNDANVTPSSLLTGYKGVNAQGETIVGAMPDRSNSSLIVTSSSGLTLNEGYYPANKQITLDQASLANSYGINGSNILAGNTYLGVQGQIINNGNSTLNITSTSQKLNGYYNNAPIVISGLDASKIVSGNSIAGVAGTHECGGKRVVLKYNVSSSSRPSSVTFCQRTGQTDSSNGTPSGQTIFTDGTMPKYIYFYSANGASNSNSYIFSSSHKALSHGHYNLETASGSYYYLTTFLNQRKLNDVEGVTGNLGLSVTIDNTNIIFTPESVLDFMKSRTYYCIVFA